MLVIRLRGQKVVNPYNELQLLQSVITRNRGDNTMPVGELTRQVLAIADKQLHESHIYQVTFNVTGESVEFIREGGRLDFLYKDAHTSIADKLTKVA